MKIKRIILSIILLMVFFACKINFGSNSDSNSKKYSKIIIKKFTLNKETFIEVKNTSGNIQFLPAKDNILQIKGEICSNKSEEGLNDVEMKITQNDNNISIATKYLKKITNAWINYTILIPSGSTIKKIESVSGDIKIDNIKTKLDLKNKANNKFINIHSISGDISIHSTQSYINTVATSSDINIINSTGVQMVKTISGNICIEDLFGNMYINTTSGDIEVLKSIGVLSIKTLSGNIKVNGKTTIKEIYTMSGDISMGGVQFLDNSNMKTISGNIEMNFIEGVNNLIINFSSVSGDLNTGKMTVGMQTNNGKYFITLGKEGNHLKISTVSGDLSLKKILGSI